MGEKVWACLTNLSYGTLRAVALAPHNSTVRLLSMKYWKIYTGAYIAVLAMALLSRLSRGEGMNILGVIVIWGAAVALVGLVRQKPLLMQWVWKMVAVLYALFIVSLPIGGAYMAITSSENEMLLVLFLLALALLLAPAAYGTYLYGFKSGYLWNPQSN